MKRPGVILDILTRWLLCALVLRLVQGLMQLSLRCRRPGLQWLSQAFLGISERLARQVATVLDDQARLP